MKHPLFFCLLMILAACSGNSSKMGERLVYLKISDGNADLYSADVFGQWEERLTSGPGYDRSPKWNATLNKLIYYSNDSLGNFNVLSMDLRTGTTDTLPFSDLDNYQLSPDGRFIFYTVSEGETTHIWRVDIDGSNPEQLTHHEGYNGRFSISPNVEKMAFISDRTGTNQLFILDLKSMELEQISFFPLMAKYSSWSPDGKQLALCLAGDAEELQWDIWLYTTANGALERITNTVYSEQEIAWSISGRKIAFHGTTASDGDQIYTIDLVDGSFVKITSGNFYHGEPTWVPSPK